jgi:hypothetical protein
MSTDFLDLVLKHLIVHSCGALCTTAVHDFYVYASGAAGSSPSPSSMAVSRRCFLSVGVQASVASCSGGYMTPSHVYLPGCVPEVSQLLL